VGCYIWYSEEGSSPRLLLAVPNVTAHPITVLLYNGPFFCGCNVPINPLIATLKLHSNGPSYSNTVIGTLAVDAWAVTFGTARRGARPGSSLLYQM